MTRISLSEAAHDVVREHLYPGAVAIDATLGNGHDTLFLAQCVGDCGRVFGFDVQQQALDNTRQRLREHGVEGRASLFLASHAEMADHVPDRFHGHIAAVMFNLGYLPGSDKKVITTAVATLAALESAVALLAERGVITVLAYPGHAGGDSETRQLTDWCERLPQQLYRLETIDSGSGRATAPRLFIIRKQVDLL